MRRSILIMDDHGDTREFISFTLKLAGYDVATTSNIEGACSYISEERFDLLMFDYHLPGRNSRIQNGLELCRHVRKSDMETPIVLMTDPARADFGDPKALDGISEYLPKPLEMDALLNCVARFCG